MATTDLPEPSRSGPSSTQQSPRPALTQQPTQKQQSSVVGCTTAFAWWRRLGWMVLIWGASIVALAAVASLLKLFMNAAGLTA